MARNPTYRRIARIRHAIRETGGLNREARGMAFGLGVGTAGAAAVGIVALLWRTGALAGIGWLFGAVIVIAIAIIAFLGMALCILLAERSYRRVRIHRSVEEMRPAERADLLRPLQKDPAPETRELAGALLGEFDSGEVVPAESHAGRGDEPAPAGTPGGRGDETTPDAGSPPTRAAR